MSPAAIAIKYVGIGTGWLNKKKVEFSSSSFDTNKPPKTTFKGFSTFILAVTIDLIDGESFILIAKYLTWK